MLYLGNVMIVEIILVKMLGKFVNMKVSGFYFN